MTTQVAETGITIARPAAPAIVKELEAIVAEAQVFVVDDVESNAIALERFRALNAGEKRITEAFEPSRKAADAAKKEILALRDGLIAPIAEARRIYDEKASAYETEQKRIAAEREAQLQAQAQKEEEDRQLADAIDAEARGDVAGAAAIMEEQVAAPAVSVPAAVARVEGVSSRTTWSAQVHESKCKTPGCVRPDHEEAGLLELIRYVAAHPEWTRLLEPAQKVLNGLAVAQHAALSIPGVRAVSRSGRASR